MKDQMKTLETRMSTRTRLSTSLHRDATETFIYGIP